MAFTREVRPEVRPSRTRWEILLEILSFVGILSILLTLFSTWAGLPDQVPSHYDFSGSPDQWGSKFGLLIIPAITIILQVSLTWLAMHPWRFNYIWPINQENAERQYRLARVVLAELKTLMVWMFAYVTYKETQIAAGEAKGMGLGFLPITLLVIFALIATYLQRSHQAR